MRKYLLLLCFLIAVGCTGQLRDMAQVQLDVKAARGYCRSVASKGVQMKNVNDIQSLGAALYSGSSCVSGYAQLQHGQDGSWSFAGSDAKLVAGNTLRCMSLSPYQPSGLSDMSVSESSISFTFRVSSAEPSSQIDILAAAYGGTGIQDGRKLTIPLQFEHPLAAVNFRASKSLADARVVSVKLLNLYSKADCSVSPLESGGTLFSWTNRSEPKDYYVDFSSNPPASDGLLGVEDDTFFLIPQTLGQNACAFIDLKEGDSLRRSVTSLEGIVLEPGKLLTFMIGKGGEITVMANSIDDLNDEDDNIF